LGIALTLQLFQVSSFLKHRAGNCLKPFETIPLLFHSNIFQLADVQFLTCKIPATVCGGCKAKDADSNEGLEAAEERAEMGRDGQSAS
jgi:hypothetical protein